MKEHSLEVLEYKKIIKMTADRAATNIGQEIVNNLKPVNNADYIQERLAEVTAMKSMIAEFSTPPFGGVRDIRDDLKKAAKGSVLSTDAISRVRSTLRGVSELQRYLESIKADLDPRIVEREYQLIYDLCSDLQNRPGLAREIDRCINEYGELADDASAKLKSLRSKMDSIENSIRDKLDSIIKSNHYQDMLQENIVTRRENRYVVPVKQEQRNNFDGIVHGQSASGLTLFMEPMAVVRLNNELREVRAKESAEIQRILQMLSSKIAQDEKIIKRDLMIITRLDSIAAAAKFSLDFECNAPEINEKGLIELNQARHPLLKEDPVPIDLKLGDDITTLVITGPNTGGKTVALKTVGLLTLMTQTGLHIPAAANSTVAVFKKIFADIGDEQSIEQSLSTFSSHMHRIREFLAESDDSTLVLMDELGVGTDPEEGAALGISILEKLQQKNAVTIATTHYSQLKSYAYTTDEVENASVEFDIETLKPTYKLIMGVPGGSNAFEIALRLGIPQEIIDRARTLLSDESIKVEDIINELNQERNRYQKLREEMEELRDHEKKLKEKYEKMIEEQQQKHEKEMKAAREEAEAIVEETKKETKRIISNLKSKDFTQRSEVDRAQTSANQNLKELSEILEAENEKEKEKIDADEFKEGDQVRVRSIGRKGEITSIDRDKKEAQIQAGIMQVTASLADLVKVDIPDDSEEKQLKNYRVKKAQHVSPKLDLRGERYEAAQYKVDKYLDDAFLAGLNEVEIVHGKGTGALRNAVEEVLEKNSHVQDYRLGRQKEGGMGVTIVKIQ
ncbi:MAG: DNA mismatch repair protein MutS2 [Halanaerobium sp. 4-GBenrich]|uniref:Endonuclease MutS2 n=1 Tax=Halanaerobium congolense TaxID=54121 RepID=A0A1G6HUV9_9FIRM|nr:endonuclease MutS2 [Halanaerobium congolense]KXS49117.1 MAG: DNA mismatch repair protein MutS2 [Halanaerobium sp. T82-1]ODS50826.1 MAG: DNA mismatch repair protein MutS2 [Halanaerobium sp. 4-GBenrich]PTX16973.1 DNA mismatch repair protein MutS2 [Halanaerobium congolense]TDS31761.1 DNA mismatch repair protein MutS2 [Halanaerobium congolense]TDX48073.1 DNA mismatch repair protein MutS2 [Halanaerobium congolense]